ncbi:MAG: winged helix-turn-helix domain-containing protein [Tissierellia bacterium]|nr:winged helix-turn-helix domain-containing protein [Tissierellia bacterium]
MIHEDLGSMIGSSRSTVTRLLKELENEGAIIRKGKTIVVVD